MQQLVEAAGRLVANRSVLASGVTAPYGTIDETGRVKLMKKVLRVFDIEKNNQIKNSFTGVPETDMRCAILPDDTA